MTRVRNPKIDVLLSRKFENNMRSRATQSRVRKRQRKAFGASAGRPAHLGWFTESSSSSSRVNGFSCAECCENQATKTDHGGWWYQRERRQARPSTPSSSRVAFFFPLVDRGSLSQRESWWSVVSFSSPRAVGRESKHRAQRSPFFLFPPWRGSTSRGRSISPSAFPKTAAAAAHTKEESPSTWQNQLTATRSVTQRARSESMENRVRRSRGAKKGSNKVNPSLTFRSFHRLIRHLTCLPPSSSSSSSSSFPAEKKQRKRTGHSSASGILRTEPT